MCKQGNSIQGVAAGLLVTAGVLCACGVAVAQQEKAPLPPAAGPARGAAARPQAAPRPAQARPRSEGTMVQGIVLQKDMKANAVQIKTFQGDGWVQFPKGAPLFRFVPAKLEDLKEKDTVTVYGTPTALDARSIEAVTPAAPPEPAAAGAAPAPAAPAEQFLPKPSAMAAVTGTVASLNPLVLLVGPGLKVTVAADARTRVLRRAETTLESVAVGDVVRALGDMQRADIMQARAGWVGPEEQGERPAEGARPGGARPAEAGAAGGRQGAGRRPRERRQGGGQPGGQPAPEGD